MLQENMHVNLTEITPLLLLGKKTLLFKLISLDLTLLKIEMLDSEEIDLDIFIFMNVHLLITEIPKWTF